MDIYERHINGEKIDFESLSTDHDEEDFVGATVANGVGIIPIVGPIAKRMNLMTNISGGTSSDILQRDISAMASDDSIKSIILLVDSPGGEVDGTQAAAHAVYAASSRNGGKPIYAIASGVCASAAYWIASAADFIYVADDTTRVGSIGVAATHVDVSKREEKKGIKVTEITAGKYKRIASEHEPLSDDGRAGIQAQLDKLYKVFVDDVARNRGVSAEDVLKNMADGKIFIGKESIDAGLTDGRMNLSDLLSRLISKENSMEGSTSHSFTATNATTSADGSMNVTIRIDPASIVATDVEVEKKKSEDVEEKPAAPVVPVVPEPEKVEPAQPEPAMATNKNEGEEMLETQIRQILKLDEKASIEEALKAAAKTRELASGSGENAVVSLFDHTIVLERTIALERALAEANAENARIKDEHTKELRRRDAAALVGKAVEEGRITPHMAEQWGNSMALTDPAGFTKVLASMPRLVRVNEGEGSGADALAMTAAEQARQEVKTLRSEYVKEGKTSPSERDLQNEVFARNPKLAKEYIAEVRGL